MLLFFLSLTPLLWLKDGEIILGHDSGFRLNPIQHLVNLFYSWDPSSNFGIDWSWFKGFLVAQAPEAFFITLTKSFTVGQELTFIFWFFCIGISMYIFINAFFPERKYWAFRTFSSTFYMYNFFLLQAWFITERAKFSLFSTVPLGILCIYKTLRNEYSLTKGVILFSFTSFLLNAGGNATFYGSLVLIYGITFIYLTVVNIGKKGINEVPNALKSGFFLILGFLAANFYWILPQMYSFLSGYGSKLGSLGGIQSIIDWESFLSQNASFINLLRLQGIPDWYDNSLHTYGYLFTKHPLLIALSFAFPIIVLLGLFYHDKLSRDKKNNTLIILALILFIVGLFLTAGSHPPLGFIYVFFMENIPGFAIFRSAFYKFGAVLWFSYIFLISFYLSSFLLKIAHRKKLYLFLTTFSFVLLLGYHFPFFNGNFFIWNEPFATKVKIPPYVSNMMDYVNKLPQDARILLLPQFDRNSDGYYWGFWGVDSLPRLITNKSIIENSTDHPEIVDGIYYAVAQSDESAFLRLSGVFGINKVLWRDDVLYADKIRMGKDFTILKRNLENFQGVKLEKKIGEWSLYAIESPYYSSFFYAADSIISVVSESSEPLIFFREETETRNTPILFSDSSQDKNKNILSFSSKNIIEAECVVCKPGDLNPKGGGLLILEAKVLPNSPFYQFLLSKEQSVHKLYADKPSQRVDADLGYANKRLVEMKEIANTKKPEDTKSKFIIRQTVNRYRALIADAIEQTDKLDVKKRNESLIKISSFLNSHFLYLKHKVLYDNSLEEFEELSIFMQDRIEFLKEKIWASDLAENKIREIFVIDESEKYDLYIEPIGMQSRAINLDGVILSEFKDVLLTKGTHKLEISYPTIKNLIDVSQASQSGEMTLPFGKRVKFPVKDFDPQDTYFVSFDYKISYGRPNAFIVEKSKNSEHILNLFLSQNDEWNSLNYTYKPKELSTYVSLEFTPTGFQTTGAVMNVKNLKVVKVIIPKVLISRSVQPKVAMKSPKISYSIINTTRHRINVEASSPFVLAFGDSYSQGWRAYIIEKDDYGENIIIDFVRTFFIKPIPEEQHYTLNSYINGWLIDKEGRYSIIVEYFPQKVFYIGLLFSVISLISFALILLRRQGKL